LDAGSDGTVAGFAMAAALLAVLAAVVTAGRVAPR